MNPLLAWWKGSGHTYRSFYRETGISDYTMIRLLHDRFRNSTYAPHAHTLIRLSEATGIPAEELLDYFGRADVGRGHIHRRAKNGKDTEERSLEGRG